MKSDLTKRLFDVVFACLILIPAIPIGIIVAIAVKLTSEGSVLYWSDRVGRNSVIFSMPKFRTMESGTPALATHLFAEARSALTPVGAMLRKTSLDELPQLWSVIKGEMSFVGPRPALFNQDDLIALRREAGIDALRPGITGWAQINGRDELPISAKVALDREYFEQHSLRFDLIIVLKTAAILFGDKTVTH